MSHVFRIRVATLFLMFGFLAVVPLRSADSTDGAVQREFEKTIRPFLTTYCFALSRHQRSRGAVRHAPVFDD
jgi:hypothetical protein